MTWLAAVTTPSEASGAGAALAYLGVAVVVLIVLGPLAFLIGRDANRRRRNGWVWGLMFPWQPVIVGVVYLIVRHRPPRGPQTPPAGGYPDPSGATPQLRWWDGRTWTDHVGGCEHMVLNENGSP
jgi:MFS family permease